MNAVSLLCEIIAQRGKVTSGCYRSKYFDALIRHGFLREAGIAASVVCVDCEVPHSEPVVFDDGGYGYYCAECGFVALDAAEITTFAPDLPNLIHRLAEGFVCQRRKSSPLSGQTWRIGAVETASEPVMLYFHPVLQTEDDARDLQSALGREVRSDWRLVVTTQGSLPVEGVAVVRLDDLVETDLETGGLRGLADLGTLAGVPPKRTGGRPSDHGNIVASIIRERIEKGQALVGRNAEADAVIEVFLQRNPRAKAPSRSSIRTYVSKIRGEQ